MLVSILDFSIYDVYMQDACSSFSVLTDAYKLSLLQPNC